MSRGARRQARPGTEVAKTHPGSMVQVRIGNHTYDAVYVSSCHTCTHPARMLIEERIIQGHSYRGIAEFFSEREIEVEEGRKQLMPRIGYMSIRNHFVAGHMPLEAATLRRLSERRAQQLGVAIEEGVDKLVDQYTLAEAVVHRTYDRLVTGEIEPEVRDGLVAAKFLQDVEERQLGGFDSEAWSQAMTVYFETARALMPEGMWTQFTQALANDPILRAIEQRLNPADPDDDNVLDAEVVQSEGT